jgi:glycerophosphoryl diester phosphodiesterase
VNLLRGDGRVLRIGHRGAATLAPENTLQAFEVAVGLGVDLVEFDVVSLADGTLVVAHSDDLAEVTHGAARGRVGGLGLAELRRLAPALPTLDEALAWFAGRPEVGLHVDLKRVGAERELAAAVGAHGVAGRTLVSTSLPQSLRVLADVAPQVARGLTYPHDRRGLSKRPYTAPVALAGAGALRATLPARLRGLLAAADATVAVLHHVVVSRAAVARAHALGIPVLAWTVDGARVLRRVLSAGVDGVITNDPRIFDLTTLRP